MLLCKIIGEARAAPTTEICGLLAGFGDDIRSAQNSANVAADPRRFFEIDPALLIAAYRRERDGGDRVIGFYHSHPGGDTVPSPRDAESAAPDRRIWLIVANGAARMWRAVPKGNVYGRFDPVAFEIAGDKREGGRLREVRMPNPSDAWSLEFDDFPD